MKSNRRRRGSAPRVAGVIVGGVGKGTIRKALSAGADLLELRIDTFRQRDPCSLVRAIERLKAVEGARSIPLVITVRSKAEGGLYGIPAKKRLEIFQALMPFADYVDIELSSGTILKDVVRSAGRSKTKVIVSYHNFRSTPGPDRLGAVAAKARASGADIVKIAAFARKRADLRTLALVLLGGTDLVVIAMGALGAPTRVFFPVLGSLLSYGSVTGSTAPGQLPIRTIRKELGFYGL
jgi:3-dehydroquinate dehydratase-1